MRYKVEFENNQPVRAIPVHSGSRIADLTDFGEENGRSSVKFLYVDAESEHDAIQQAERIVTTIFRF
jgi:hypothetical protein